MQALLLALLLGQAPVTGLATVVDSPAITLLINGESGVAPDGFGNICQVGNYPGGSDPVNAQPEVIFYCEPAYWFTAHQCWGHCNPAENPYPYCDQYTCPWP